MKKITRRLVSVMLALVLIAGLPLLSAEGTADAASSTRPVRLLMLDRWSEDNTVAVWAFGTIGVKVVTVYSLRDVDPAKYDGLLVPGGVNDVDPRLYNAKDSGKNYKPDINFDKRQIAAIKRFARAGKPVFGICRGLQIINVAFGGRLKQNIKRHSGRRVARNVKGSWIYKVDGRKRVTYHMHHQGIKKLGKHLKATSYDVPSGEIEAIEHVSLPIYAVQWHPEALKLDPNGVKVLKAFRNVCLKYRKLNTKKR